MVTTQEGILTSNNVGAYNATGGTGERVLIDYKDALQDYKVTDLPALQLFTETMTTDTGGDIDLTFAMPSMNLERIDEGTTPKYQHTKMRSERVAVREWGIAVGVTRRMIEDSRFNEVELALNEARRAVDRHMSKHVVYALMGIYDADLQTGINSTAAGIVKGTAEVGSNGVADFADNLYGGFLGSGTAAQVTAGSGRFLDYGLAAAADLARSHYVEAATDSVVSLAEITNAIDLIGQHGYNADTIVISPKHYKSLLDLADFTVAQGAANSPIRGGAFPERLEQTANTGLVGTLFGLNIFVNAYIPSTRYGVFDLSAKPMAYVERRPMTVEEANPGFGIVGSYMSMRYGLKVIKPETGVIFYN